MGGIIDGSPDNYLSSRINDACTDFMNTVEITPESPVEYQSRKEGDYELVDFPGNNKGVVVRVYCEGTSKQKFEVMNVDWRKLKEGGLVAIVGAQRQQAIYTMPAGPTRRTESAWENNAIFYGIPARKSELKSDVPVNEAR
ncbi:TPA: hypothetical protein HA251_03300 [Candidatus Woesearchaeota archaeon]|nr:hypothetical protein [Candidatus Woesearchaeota archaeon]